MHLQVRTISAATVRTMIAAQECGKIIQSSYRSGFRCSVFAQNRSQAAMKPTTSTQVIVTLSAATFNLPTTNSSADRGFTAVNAGNESFVDQNSHLINPLPTTN